MAKKFGNANPIMSKIGSIASERSFVGSESAMTLQGTINKSLLLIGILMVAASISWSMYFTNPSQAVVLTYGGMFGGIGVAIALYFKQEWAPQLAWLYAVLEGLFLGGLSASYALSYEGIVYKAIGLTICVLLLMLILYRFQIIKVTEKLRSAIIAATGGIMLFYLVSFGFSLFTGDSLPYLRDGSLMSIGISLVIVVVASLNLLLDFDMIEKGVAAQAPKSYEWFAGFALLATLVWLYFELLRLLSYLSGD